MKISGRAFVIDGDDLSADVIYPSRYLTLTKWTEQASHVFEGLGKDLPEKIKGHNIIVAGWNLGPGSAREQTATGLLGAGVKLVIAKSFSRMFFRNALNSGLALVESPDLATEVHTGDSIVMDLTAGLATLGRRQIRFAPLLSHHLKIMEAGGLWQLLKKTRAELKLERPGEEKNHNIRTTKGSQTLTEKILSRAARKNVKQGQFVEIEPDWTYALDDGIGASVEYLKSNDVSQVRHPDRIALFYDHFSPANNFHHAELQAIGRRFAAEQKIHSLHDIGEGISHQVVADKGLLRPGHVTVNMDSHNMTLGGLGALGLAVGNGEMAYLWAAGSTWFRVPGTIRVNLQNCMPSFTTAKDVALSLLRDKGLRWASYRALEFQGDALRHLSIAERMTLCNMGTELGAKTAIVPPDEITVAHFAALNIKVDIAGLISDSDADYIDKYEIDLSSLVPLVACPHAVQNVRPVSSVRRTKITQAYLGTCTNGRYEDLVQAAQILKGRRIAAGVRMIVTPASRGALLRGMKDGTIESLIESGCTIASPGCGACAGVHQGILSDEDICISSGSRNYAGRMGGRHAQIYLGSAATVAASALTGELQDPREV